MILDPTDKQNKSFEPIFARKICRKIRSSHNTFIFLATPFIISPRGLNPVMSGPPTELLELVLVPLLFRRFVEDEGLAEAEALAEIHRQMGLTTTDSSSFASLATATGGASWRDSAAYLQQYLGATVAKLDTRWRACDACSATGSPWRGEPEASANERVAAGLAGPHGSCLGAKVLGLDGGEPKCFTPQPTPNPTPFPPHLQA